jgi:polyketide biosynthesis 3-hydroxy-3-methylglutaryl-CoA synthase-like enzyme PksG
MATMPPIGIQAMHAYGGSVWLDAEELYAARELDLVRLANIGVSAKGVALPDEDTVAMAATAAWPVLAACDPAARSRIRGLIVATESAVDMSKSVGAYLHRLLELPRTCRQFEVKQACYGGVAALQTAAALVATDPGSTVLVVATDLPASAASGGYLEACQGAGAVAALVGVDPAVAELELGTAGCYSYEVADFIRPRIDLEIVDTDLSLMAYLDCVVGAVGDHLDRNPGRNFAGSFDLLAMHTPFPGMVRGAHRAVMRKMTDLDRAGIEADFDRRVAPSLTVPAKVGNIYSASTLLAMYSTIVRAQAPTEQTLGVFSYGSGCSSEFFAARVQAGAGQLLPAADRIVADRARITIADYDRYLARSALTGSHPIDPAEFADVRLPGRPRAVLTGVTNHHREYAWLPQS